VTLKQADAQASLQAIDAPTHRRLVTAKLATGCGQTAGARGGKEIADIVPIHDIHLRISIVHNQPKTIHICIVYHAFAHSSANSGR
jgi:hypothetical protein